MSINVKKYTKDQMAKMVEEAQEAAEKMNGCMNELRSRNSELELQVRTLKAKNAALTEQLDQMNGEAINKANEIANLKADADALRVQLKNANDTMEAVSKELQRVNSGNDALRNENKQMWDEKVKLVNRAAVECERADYAESHPWRNLCGWLQRKLKMA